ncbi:MAG: hypothetical protein M1828_007466 [Chrysothrix sp. TS-e1954]|nr:MAG: hypothetical protein M1828_007466 [Chrysothrix sp. TS-e1954]
MVGLPKRTRRLQEKVCLLDVRLGPGAAIISPSVKRIHMGFAKKINEGHMGPRKFWHENLPRLKYHNPAVSMTVERTEDQSGPSQMIVYLATRQNESDAPSKEADLEETKRIDMKEKHSSEILAELMRMTGGKEVRATPEEQRQLDELAEQKRRSDQDKAVMLGVTTAKRREKQFLDQAKRSVEAQASM